jgi:hypothetical protein
MDEAAPFEFDAMSSEFGALESRNVEETYVAIGNAVRLHNVTEIGKKSSTESTYPSSSRSAANKVRIFFNRFLVSSIQSDFS